MQSPMTTPPLTAADAPTPPPAVAKILVVDDEPAIVDAVTYNLRLQGFTTLVAGDADAALRLFREKQPDLAKTAEVVKEQLAAVGVQTNLNEMEWGAYLKATDNREVDFFHMRWAADYIDPQNFLSLLLHSEAPENRTAYSNPQYDRLCEQADAETDPAKRMALYNQAEKIVVDDAPWVPIYFQRDLELIKPYVTGIRDGLMGHLPHITTQTG